MLHLLVAFQQDGRWKRLLWCVPLAVLWANSHGSFLLGPVVAGIFATGEAEAAPSAAAAEPSATAGCPAGEPAGGAPAEIAAVG